MKFILKNQSRRNKKILYGIFLFFSDAIFLSLSFLLSSYIRFNLGIFTSMESGFLLFQNISYLYYSLIYVAINILIFSIHKLYNWDYFYIGSAYYSRIIKSISISIIFIILFGYIYETFSFSRIWIGLLYLFSLVFIIISRLIISKITNIIIKQLSLASNTVIVGLCEESKRIEISLQKNESENFRVIGYVCKPEIIEKNKDELEKFKLLGFTSDLKNIILDNNVKKIIIVTKNYNYHEILNILEELKNLDVLVLISPGYFEFSIRRVNMRDIGGIPLLQVSKVGFFGIDLFLKYLVDYILGIILFVLFIFLYIIIAPLIKIDSRGPVLYKQKRITKNFKEFYIYKFRTMYDGADIKIKEIKNLNEADGPIFKIKNDPRITNFGRFLRRFSIDELPQIINVIKGELSIVGPRPPLPDEVKKYKDWHKKRLNVKQGITGLWQISGRSNLSFEEMVKLDLFYIQNWSIGIDIKILLKTIPAVLFGIGSY